MKRVEYALYKGEELLAIGKVDEIAEQMGVKEKTIQYYQTPTWQKRCKKENSKRRVLIKIEGD